MEQLGKKNDPTRLSRDIFVPSNNLCKCGSSAAPHTRRTPENLFSLTGSQNRVLLRRRKRAMAAGQRPAMGPVFSALQTNRIGVHCCVYAVQLYICACGGRHPVDGGAGRCKHRCAVVPLLKVPGVILHLHSDMVGHVLFLRGS